MSFISCWRAALLVAAAACAALPARAEVSEVRIAQQFGLGYLPLLVMKQQKLVEKQAAAAGIDKLAVTWARLGGGPAVNDALLSGSLDFGSAGLGPLFLLWDRTRNNLGVRGVGGLDASLIPLNVTDPKVKTVADIGEGTKIALPGIKVSYQAVLLQMAAAKTFGPANWARFDPFTVTMAHPDALIALLSGRSEINGHFANPPFSTQELADKRVRSILTNRELLGDDTSVVSVLATGKFREANPKVYKAVFAALREAHAFIAAHRTEAVRIYVEEEKYPGGVAEAEQLIADGTVKFSLLPRSTEAFGQFLHQIGSIKQRPERWQDYFFPEVAEIGTN